MFYKFIYKFSNGRGKRVVNDGHSNLTTGRVTHYSAPLLHTFWQPITIGSSYALKEWNNSRAVTMAGSWLSPFSHAAVHVWEIQIMPSFREKRVRHCIPRIPLSALVYQFVSSLCPYHSAGAGTQPFSSPRPRLGRPPRPPSRLNAA